MPLDAYEDRDEAGYSAKEHEDMWSAQCQEDLSELLRRYGPRLVKDQLKDLTVAEEES